MIITQFNITPKNVRPDNIPEFMLHQFYASKCITHHMSYVENHQQNGKVERKHQHLLNVGRAILYQFKVPNTYWSFALQFATFIFNRIPTLILHHKSPYQILCDKLPNLDTFKVLDYLCYVSTLQAHRTKLDHKERKSIFIGLN